ncbi:hypothetical protein BDR26DRAFT_1006001 [Obelidium mucronatum]|nr:hypothetical protein BDR26DRAFT_1006001 [Obelidium mucronatum]
MDFISKLKAVETKIKTEKRKKKSLKKKYACDGGLSSDDQIKLKWCQDTLVELKTDKAFWADLIRIQTKDDAEPESKSFKEADEEWISSVTRDRHNVSFVEAAICASYSIRLVSQSLRKGKLPFEVVTTIAPPQELHLAVVEAKADLTENDYYQCVAETSTLYKSRKDAGKENCNVWGVLSNATDW